ncbi:hypothetical protein [Bacillus sp. AFS015802]|uniref:hypothetical protein n=1 Tax=Bacillus sp. AFS015802 TaxID=2033486 RepID=UPI0015CF24DA|nr:hypothetical protein [Bacillus sp. AFS015802]
MIPGDEQLDDRVDSRMYSYGEKVVSHVGRESAYRLKNIEKEEILENNNTNIATLGM